MLQIERKMLDPELSNKCVTLNWAKCVLPQIEQNVLSPNFEQFQIEHNIGTLLAAEFNKKMRYPIERNVRYSKLSNRSVTSNWAKDALPPIERKMPYPNFSKVHYSKLCKRCVTPNWAKRSWISELSNIPNWSKVTYPNWAQDCAKDALPPPHLITHYSLYMLLLCTFTMFSSFQTTKFWLTFTTLTMLT